MSEYWIDKHSVSCCWCGNLIDERECIHTEDDDNPYICNDCADHEDYKVKGDTVEDIEWHIRAELARAMAAKIDAEITGDLSQSKGDLMKIPGRINFISIMPKTSGAVVMVRYDDKERDTYGNDIEEEYACITLADTKEILNVWLRELFWAQEDYFAPEPDDEPVKRKARKPKAYVE